MNVSERIEQRPDAVAWVDASHAIVALRDPAGRISTVEVRRMHQPEPRYLAQVVHELGGHEHVMLIGPDPIRIALERRFVAVTHRPDSLMAPVRRIPPEPSRLVEGAPALAA